MASDHYCVPYENRFLADAPRVFEERVRKLLPFLLGAHEKYAVVFILPALLQIASEDQPLSDEWAEALVNPKVPSIPIVPADTCEENTTDAVWAYALPNSEPSWHELLSVPFLCADC